MNKAKLSVSIALIIFFAGSSCSQQYRLSGKVFDSKTRKSLEYVTIKVSDTTYGTTADKNGNYILKIDKGSFKIIFSMVGYFTDTQAVYIDSSDVERNVFLNPSELFTETIEVLGEDPAYDIIRKAIKYKKEFRSKLNEYNYDAYTKFIIRSDMSPVKKDSLTEGGFPILAILESETSGYFKKPDKYKEIVKSKRETANIPRGVAIPYIVNYYDEVINLNEIKVTGPLADDAMDYYEYHLAGLTSIDSNKVFKIDVKDGSGIFPLFYGTVYIMDSIFALVKVDLSNNEASKPPGIDNINFRQKFTAFDDVSGSKFWMPTDVQINADISFAGLFRFSGEVFTIVSGYRLNQKAPPGIFDEYVIKVLPDAKKDSLYWKQSKPVKSSGEENAAYKQIEYDTKKKMKKFNFGFTSIDFGNIIRSYPLNYFRFNRVEGSHLQLNLDINSRNRRNFLNSMAGYGFSDEKLKYEVNYTGVFLKDRSLRIKTGVYNRLQLLSVNSISGLYGAFNTLTSLFDKSDYYDYYYSSGWNLSISKQLIQQIRLDIKYSQDKQTSANKNTDYSVRKNSQPFRVNPPVNEAFSRIIGTSVLLDLNKYSYIDFGNGEESRYSETDFPTLTLGADFSFKKLNSSYENKNFTAVLAGKNYFNRLINLRYSFGAALFSGDIPVQSLGYFNASSAPWVNSLSFRTMKYREFLGDKIYWLNLENNFGNLIWSKIKFTKKWNLLLFYNAGKSMISESNYRLAADKNFSSTDNIFMEAGFGIGNIFDLLRFDFTWRLTNLANGNNFAFKFSFITF
jgi:hypothetical protein